MKRLSIIHVLAVLALLVAPAALAQSAGSSSSSSASAGASNASGTNDTNSPVQCDKRAVYNDCTLVGVTPEYGVPEPPRRLSRPLYNDGMRMVLN